ncbi:hypothetical protein M1555_05110 [Patescibacteria group bacterium]|nr:hypothetical protein [Patescibacteria group bacterium]
MRKKGNSTHYIIVSVLLIIMAIAATAVVNRAKSPETNTTDIRAKASAVSTLKLTATVTEVNATQGTFTIENTRFADNAEGADLGTWTVTPPPLYTLATLSPGSRVTITFDPQSFLATQHTVSATQITVGQ